MDTDPRLRRLWSNARRPYLFDRQQLARVPFAGITPTSGITSMSKPSFTPGPWRLKESGSIGNAIEAKTEKNVHKDDDGYRIVATYQDACESDLYVDQEVNRRANGRLIAAAPELYEALETIANHFADVMGGPLVSGQGVCFTDGVEGIPTIARARAALARARGE